MEASAIKMAEASTLLKSGHTTGSIYLAGYVVEMILKVAYFQLKTPNPNELITKEMRKVSLLIEDGFEKFNGKPAKDFHDLESLLNLVINYRSILSLPKVEPGIMGEVEFQVLKFAKRWKVDLCYSPETLSTESAFEYYHSVLSLYLRKKQLWRH